LLSVNITSFLIVPLISWFIIQLVKFAISLVKGEANIRYLFASGGMPSAHSGIVCSLATIALVEEGASSPLFGITAILAAIVMYDSFGVRRSAGDISRTLNRLIDDLGKDKNVKSVQNYSHIREILGHKPSEVFVGALIGIAVAMIYDYSIVSAKFSFLFSKPSSVEMIAMALLGAGLIIGGLVYGRVISSKARKILAYKRFRKQVISLSLIGGILMLALSFCQYQSATYLSMRLVGWSLIFIWVVVSFSICSKTALVLREASFQAQLQDRKLKWLKKAGKK
jgi:acid phosphatase family membrane protein YuiD